MGRFDGILICSDVDGTLTAQSGIVSEENVEAIRRFQAQGGLFTLATGRYATFADRFPFRCNAPVIAANGSQLWDPATRRVLWTFPMDGCGALIEEIGCCSVPRIVLHYTDELIETRGTDCARAVRAHTTGELLKIVCVFDEDCEPEAVAFRDRIRARFRDRYGVMRSWATGVEILSPLAGKGNCLKYLCAALPEPPRLTVAVGDYENDLSILRAADRSYAPANACAEVLAEVGETLPSAAEHAVSVLIGKLEREFAEENDPPGK